MKTWVFMLLALLCNVTALAQELELDSTTEKLMYRRLVTVDSAKAGDLYERAKQWMARAYMSADNVIQYDNKEEGKLMGRGVWKPSVSLNNERNEHVIIIECRDGRARYTFTDFVTETYDATLGKMRKPLEGVKTFKKSVREYYAKKAADMGAELEKALTVTAEQKKKDDGW